MSDTAAAADVGGEGRKRIFLSSPGDVSAERERAETVIRALSAELSGMQLDCVRWEGRPYSALSTFQAQIDRPSECDLVICVLWKRLGSELPPDFNRPDGTARTGTEFEFEDALDAARARPTSSPDILVFRKTAPVTFSEARVEQERAEKRDLDRFWTRWFRSEDGHFLAAFETFETTDEFAEVLQRSLRGWLNAKSRRAGWDIAQKGSPFLGLAAFDERHADVFFGRRRAVQQARAGLMAAAQSGFPALFVLGASGSGKSSLVRAGLLPLLLEPDVLAPSLNATRRAILTPAQMGPDLIGGLARELIRALPEIQEGDHRDGATLAALLRAAPSSGVVPVVAALDRWAEAEGKREGRSTAPATGLLLVLDQFEELFARTEDERCELAAVLEALVSSGRIWLVATMRSDFYDALQAAPELYQLKAKGRAFDLMPPSGGDIREMIVGPAAAASLSYEVSGERHLAAELEREASAPGALPMLQYALQALFESRRTEDGTMLLSAYDRLGGAAGALAARAEAALDSLDDDAKGAMAAVMGQLASIDLASERSGAVARTPPLAAFAPGTPARRLVDLLLRERLLLAFDEDGPSDTPPRVRIVHESLFERWPRAARQLVLDRRDLDRRTQIERAQLEWAAASSEAGESAARGRLLEGLRLAEGRELLRRRADLLSPQLTQFIQASNRAARARGRRNWILAGVVMLALAGLAATAAWFAYSSETQRAEAVRQKAQAEANLKAAVDAASELVFTLSADVEKTEGVQQAVLLRIQRLAQALLDKLTAGQELPPEAEYARGSSLLKSSDAAFSAGNGEDALRDAEAARDVFRRLVERYPENTSYHAKLGSSLQRMGDVNFSMGNMEEALRNFEESLAIAQKLMAAEPGEEQHQRSAWVAHLKLGEAQAALGRNDEALKNYETGRDIAARMVAGKPDNLTYQRNLAISDNHIGDFKLDQQDYEGALQSYAAALEIAIRLAEAEPSNAEYQRDLWLSYTKVGLVKVSLGRVDEGLPDLTAGLKIAERLAASDPSNAEYQRGIFVSHLQIGDALASKEDWASALKSYTAALEIIRRLSALDPSLAEWKYDMSLAYVGVAQASTALNDIAGARAAYGEALAIVEELARLSPNEPQYEADAKLYREELEKLKGR